MREMALHMDARARTPDARRLRASSTVPVVAAWCGLVISGGVLVYVLLVASGAKRLDGVPLHAAFDPHVSWSVAVPILVASIAIASRRAVGALPWPTLLGATWLSAATWALALALVRGVDRIGAPFGQPHDYLAVLGRVDSLGAFLSSFVDEIASFPVHVQGHPPGFVVVATVVRAVGLGGPLPLALLCVAVGAAAAPLALVTVREVAGEEWARRAAPFTVVAPTAIWVATSADAFFSGIGAAAIALLVLGTDRHRRWRDLCAVTGGMLFGVVAMLSYGLVLLAAVPLAVAAARRRVRPIALAAAAALAVIAVFAASGFWWLDGLFATRDRYYAGIASRRPYELFVYVNLAILALALGPAIAVGLARLRSRPMWIVVGAALAAILVADLSGMSKSEVERIWLPFTPFLLVAGGALARGGRTAATDRGSRRRSTLDTGAAWLAVQAGVAVMIETLVRTAW